MNFVIIGNSAAGTAAIEAIRKHDWQSSIIQLSDEPHPLYSRCLLSYYLGGTINRERLLFRGKNFHQKMEVKLHAGVGSRAVELNTNRQKVTCINGDTFDFDRLLICTGSSAKLPSYIPYSVEGIFTLRNIADVESIMKNIQNAKNAVVLGGGLIGIKAATGLSACGLRTKVVIRSNRVLSQMIDYEAAQIIKKQLLGEKIEILTNSDIHEVRSIDNKLVGVKTDQGQVLECELLIVAKGVIPNTELIQNTGVTKEWGIKTNSFMQTNNRNIFAAGDVAETFDIAFEDYTVNALWTCAVQQGRVAGLNMIDRKTAYNGAIGMNSLNVCNVSLISFGTTSPKDNSEFKISVLNLPEHNIYKKIVIGSDNLIKGIILVGKIANAGVLLSLIQSKRDVSQFEDELLNDQFNFGTLLKYGGESELERYYKYNHL